ncbi:unnamed protein product [marine sediment metagenome]|uniref:Uncharacterized protein n=1 Tax=marine sediment metagenome TaxID=412755 RepID=X1JGX3_9ZZZZ
MLETVANKIQVTVAADIAAWVNGDIVSTSKTGADSYAVELDISPLIPDGATAVFLAAQANDNGVISSGDGVRFSKEGAASTWNNVACQVSNFTIYGLQVCLLQANRHLNARDIASGVDTLQHAAFATMYIK